jgi:hypothetical protein
MESRNVKISITSIVLVVFFIVLGTRQCSNTDQYELEIDSNKGTTVGVINICRRAGSSSESVYFSFLLNGKRYSVQQKKSINLGNCVKTQDCIGQQVIVEYSKENPNIARIKVEN